MKAKENRKENTTSTPKLKSAWAYSHEVIFLIQPLMHWFAHVSEGRIDKKVILENHQTRKI